MAGVSAQELKQYNSGLSSSVIPDLRDWIACPEQEYPKIWFFQKRVLTDDFVNNVLPKLDMKMSFHWAVQKFFRGMAQDIGLDPGSYRISTNLGGCAVMGETTLHAPTFYIQVGKGIHPNGLDDGRLGMKYKRHGTDMSERIMINGVPYNLRREDVVPMYSVMYRRCDGLNDTTGKRNRWCDIAYLSKLYRRWHIQAVVKQAKQENHG